MERLGEVEIEPSVGCVGESYDHTMVETIFGLFTTEVTRPNWPRRSQAEVELATLDWVDWFSKRRLLEPIGGVPPAESEAMYYGGLHQTSPGFPGVSAV